MTSVRQKANAFLARLYGDVNVMEGPFGPIPTWVQPLSDLAQREPDRLSITLGDAPQDVARAFAKEENDPEEQRKRTRMWDGVTFSITGLVRSACGDVDGLRGYLGSYFKMRDTAGRLERELIRVADAGFSLDRLPVRRDVLGAFESPRACLERGCGVDAAIGGSTVVVFRRAGAYHVICGRRSADLDRPGMYHPAPSFMYQPTSVHGAAFDDIERRVSHNVFREYLEELFNLEPASASEVHHHPNVTYLLQLISNGDAELVGTGIVFNLVDHRPEICTLLLIHNEAWHQRHFDLGCARNYGLSPIITKMKTKESDELAIMPLASSSWSALLHPDRTMPLGVASIVLGVRAASRRVGADEPIWLRAFRNHGAS